MIFYSKFYFISTKNIKHKLNISGHRRVLECVKVLKNIDFLCSTALVMLRKLIFQHFHTFTKRYGCSRIAKNSKSSISGTQNSRISDDQHHKFSEFEFEKVKKKMSLLRWFTAFCEQKFFIRNITKNIRLEIFWFWNICSNARYGINFIWFL